ncbi:trimethylguanosine synthase-like isoform X2 [Adelges cooleyi]|uniref:trimethylguanosine synthase-like isoform X1 n=1 Tax=Adelges cooleyi TaxID=133065 RepID=UPI00217F9BA4|nr:trimethylguanosine synthase-like isoform X1 [Adelges cooleyi]XP_050427434.1 trimethylguanosine synthase-like isoform X2 [Adelges cooleyi]
MTYLDLSFFSVHTEKLAEVLYERNFCSCTEEITMVCSRVLAKPRHPGIPNDLFIDDSHSIKDENESENELELYPDLRKLSTYVENDNLELKSNYGTGMKRIISSLKDIGFVVSEDKMYTVKPSQIFYHKKHIRHFSPSRSFFPSVPETKKKRGYPSWSHSKNKLSSKYWSMRHILFSKFDNGILLDAESFYSVCPEVLSYHIAKRCRSDIAMDPFCGAGGNIIQLALTCNLVIAIDIDPEKIKYAKHNAEVYGVAHKIEFIIGDFFALARNCKMLKTDVVFMSPPWGGPKYSVDEKFSLESMCDNQFGGGYGIFDLVKKIAPSIAFHMPKTTNIFECVWLAKGFGKVEIQQNIINDRLNSITAFYGEFTEVTDNDY